MAGRSTAMETVEWATEDLSRLVPFRRFTMVGSDGSKFEGTYVGVGVKQGAMLATFEHVDGGVATAGKRRYFQVPRHLIVEPSRQLMAWEH